MTKEARDLIDQTIAELPVEINPSGDWTVQVVKLQTASLLKVVEQESDSRENAPGGKLQKKHLQWPVLGMRGVHAISLML
jgi:hypothetical protein